MGSVRLISQKTVFDLDGNELEFMEKRRNALDNIFKLGKITKATYEYLIKDLDRAIMELKTHQKLTEESKLKTNNHFYKDVETHPSKLEKSHSDKKLNQLVEPSTKFKNVIPSTLPDPVKKRSKKRKKVVPTKKRRKRERGTKKRNKKTSRKTSVRSKGYCENPWNGKCRNTNTEVLIYYNNKMLSICQECWHEIVNNNITW